MSTNLRCSVQNGSRTGSPKRSTPCSLLREGLDETLVWLEMQVCRGRCRFSFCQKHHCRRNPAQADEVEWSEWTPPYTRHLHQTLQHSVQRPSNFERRVDHELIWAVHNFKLVQLQQQNRRIFVAYLKKNNPTTTQDFSKQQSAYVERVGEDLQGLEAGSSSMIWVPMGDPGKRSIGLEGVSECYIYTVFVLICWW